MSTSEGKEVPGRDAVARSWLMLYLLADLLDPCLDELGFVAMGEASSWNDHVLSPENEEKFTFSKNKLLSEFQRLLFRLPEVASSEEYGMVYVRLDGGSKMAIAYEAVSYIAKLALDCLSELRHDPIFEAMQNCTEKPIEVPSQEYFDRLVCAVMCCSRVILSINADHHLAVLCRKVTVAYLQDVGEVEVDEDIKAKEASWMQQLFHAPQKCCKDSCVHRDIASLFIRCVPQRATPLHRNRPLLLLREAALADYLMSKHPKSGELWAYRRFISRRLLCYGDSSKHKCNHRDETTVSLLCTLEYQALFDSDSTTHVSHHSATCMLKLWVAHECNAVKRAVKLYARNYYAYTHLLWMASVLGLRSDGNHWLDALHATSQTMVEQTPSDHSAVHAMTQIDRLRALVRAYQGSQKQPVQFTDLTRLRRWLANGFTHGLTLRCADESEKMTKKYAQSLESKHSCGLCLDVTSRTFWTSHSTNTTLEDDVKQSSEKRDYGSSLGYAGMWTTTFALDNPLTQLAKDNWVLQAQLDRIRWVSRFLNSESSDCALLAWLTDGDWKKSLDAKYELPWDSYTSFIHESLWKYRLEYVCLLLGSCESPARVMTAVCWELAWVWAHLTGRPVRAHLATQRPLFKGVQRWSWPNIKCLPPPNLRKMLLKYDFPQSQAAQSFTRSHRMVTRYCANLIQRVVALLRSRFTSLNAAAFQPHKHQGPCVCKAVGRFEPWAHAIQAARRILLQMGT